MFVGFKTANIWIRKVIKRRRQKGHCLQSADKSICPPKILICHIGMDCGLIQTRSKETNISLSEWHVAITQLCQLFGQSKTTSIQFSKYPLLKVCHIESYICLLHFDMVHLNAYGSLLVLLKLYCYVRMQFAHQFLSFLTTSVTSFWTSKEDMATVNRVNI